MAKAEYEIDGETAEAEILHMDSAVALTAADRAQIDVQVATAKRYPRDVAKAVRDAIALATQDEDTAASMHYALPRKQDGKTVFIEGPSVRSAEVLVYCWGNIRAESRIVSVDDTHVTAQGTCMDLEKNIGGRVEVKRRITNKYGKKFSEDMIVVTGNAAGSIAFRNAVYRVIPAALAKRFLDAAKKMATGGAQPIEARRARSLKWFSMVGAHEARVLELLGVGTVDEITEEMLSQLSGLKNGIQEGSTTVEEAFPRPETNGAPQSAGAAKMNAALDEQTAPESKPEGPHYLAEPNKKFLSSHSKLVTLLESDYDGVKEPGRVAWMQKLTGKTSTADMSLAELHMCIDAIEGGRGPKNGG